MAFRNRTVLTCSAEGNPLPKYQWLQKLPSQQVMKRAYEDNYVIEDVSYDHQGDYVCEAINVIGGHRKIVQSDPVNIEVRGESFGVFRGFVNRRDSGNFPFPVSTSSESIHISFRNGLDESFDSIVNV